MVEVIKINNVSYPHPIDFVMTKEPNMVAQLTTMSGKVISDVNGWRYSNTTLKWNWIEEMTLRQLLADTADGVAFEFTFTDVETGEEKTVNAYRTSSVAMKNRSTDSNGNTVWTDIQIGISFPDCYHD